MSRFHLVPIFVKSPRLLSTNSNSIIPLLHLSRLTLAWLYHHILWSTTASTSSKALNTIAYIVQCLLFPTWNWHGTSYKSTILSTPVDVAVIIASLSDSTMTSQTQRELLFTRRRIKHWTRSTISFNAHLFSTPRLTLHFIDMIEVNDIVYRDWHRYQLQAFNRPTSRVT